MVGLGMKSRRALAMLPLLWALPGWGESGRVDLHLHVTMDRAAKPVFHGEPGKADKSGSSGTRLLNQVDADGLEASQVWLAVAACWPPLSGRANRDATGESLSQLEQLRAFTRAQPAFGLALNPAQARHLHEVHRIALMPALEGGEGITEVDDVDRLWRAGARAITVVHFADSQVAGAASGQVATNFFGVHSVSHNGLGLTPLGKAAVKRMVELGILVDLAHSSDATAADALDILEAAGVPAMVSHAGARVLSKSERNLSDELARRVVKGGGVVGVPLYKNQVADVPPEARFEGMVPGSCDDVIAHWLHFAKVSEPGAVLLGSDFNGFIVRPPAGGSCPDGLRTVSDLPALYAGLKKHGLKEEAVDGAYERFLALWEKVEAHASREARARALKVAKREYDLFDTP